MNRKPYKYQYNNDTLVMNGWCGLSDVEQEWLRQLEYFVDAQRDKCFDGIEKCATTEDIAKRFTEYKRNVHDAQGQILRLKSRMNMKYGY